VELLVVIGIIAILIAILLPTIAAANRTAKTTACLANIRSIGQALKIYQAEHKGSYPYAYYIAGTPTTGQAVVGDGGDSQIDAQTYVWWSVVRGVMRGRGFPMDNSIRADNGGELTRYMQAFNCPAGLNREAGCDFSGNAAIMIIKQDEEGASGHAFNRRLAKPATEKLVPADCVVIWDAPELGNVDPPYSRQYIASYYVDNEHYPGQNTLLSTPAKPANRYRSIPFNEGSIQTSDSGVIDPGINQEINSTNVAKLAGNIRWRHGRNDQANFLFGDGSAKTFKMPKRISGTPGSTNTVYSGDLVRKLFRPKLPPGYRVP
jgi:prepilin-type processing-associated H-X9-DG protein